MYSRYIKLIVLAAFLFKGDGVYVEGKYIFTCSSTPWFLLFVCTATFFPSCGPSRIIKLSQYKCMYYKILLSTQ